VIPADAPVDHAPRSTALRVLVTGSRDYPWRAAVNLGLTESWSRLGRPIRVVHGACTDKRTGKLIGADRYADDWAREHEVAGIEVERHPADWARLGKAAGPIRNGGMVDLGAVICLGFPHPEKASTGTRGCMELAEKAGIPVWEAVDGYGPQRLIEMLNKVSADLRGGAA
jgi:hypothetical protein